MIKNKWHGLDILFIAVFIFFIAAFIGLVVQDLLDHEEYTPVEYEI